MFVRSCVSAGIQLNRAYHSDFREYFEQSAGTVLPSYERLRVLIPEVEKLEREEVAGELIEASQSPSSLLCGKRIVSIGFDSSRIRKRGTTPVVVTWVDEEATRSVTCCSGRCKTTGWGTNKSIHSRATRLR